MIREKYVVFFGRQTIT